METKTFEVRDDATFIPVLAVRLDPGNEPDRYLLSRAGFGISAEEQGLYVVVLNLQTLGLAAQYDPNRWADRVTMPTAHREIRKNWDAYPSGSVIDCRFIRGERPAPCRSDAEPPIGDAPFFGGDDDAEG